MVNRYGKNLNILIVTEVGRDWRAYASWYSFYHNVPEAKVHIACLRNKNAPFQLFQWAKRLKVPLFYSNEDSEYRFVQLMNCARRVDKENLLVVDDMTMALDVFGPKILDVLNVKEVCFDPNYQVQFFRKNNIDDLLNQILLENKTPYSEPMCFEAKESEQLVCLATYRKGCGKWIDTSKGCPFSSAAGLASTEMTVNENRIIELWKRMCSMYSATA